MANPIWRTGQGQKLVNLGTVTEGSYFEYTLDAFDPGGGSVSYKFLAGNLPPGIRVNQSGLIQGGPYLNSIANKTSSFDFTVRASDSHGLVSDKSFALTVANINPPVITTPVNLGQIFDGQYFTVQLAATELNPYAVLEWSITSGSLPAGLTMNSSGLVTGFITPLTVQGSGGTQGFNATPFNEFAFENTPQYISSTYTFTVTVFDGANYTDKTYNLRVVAKYFYTADNSFTTIDNSYLTIDYTNTYIPIITTPSQTLPSVRSNSKFAFKFDAIDPNGNQINYALGLNSGAAGFDQSGTQGFDTIGFDQQNLNIPPGLTLDSDSGWLTGALGSQPDAVESYTFDVYAYEVNDPAITSVSVPYTMNILGDITNSITWTTSADLGLIDNGTVSELAVAAVNNSGRSLLYTLLPGSSLPQGLKLNQDGLLVGRTGFEFFTLDKGNTTIDGVVSNFDNTHIFSVKAETLDKTSSSTKTFTVMVNNVHITPYEDLYIKALPTLDQRQTFLSIVGNEDIFPSELLYRSSDPNFGRARDIRSLFLAGLTPSYISTYVNAMLTNTYNKKIDFGAIKTAIAVDSNFNTKYEVVYIELQHDYHTKTKSPISVYDKTIGKNIHNNSYANMTTVISDAIGYSNIGALPDWMTSPQADKTVLGFTRAIVLAYTLPGKSELIAYRLKSSGISFSDINFVADRYDLDNSYSANFNIATQTYDLGRETTFDRIQRGGVITTSASYSISGLAFNQINNQSTDFINAHGGLDGKTDYQDGDTLIFLQQENFGGSVGQYDGWIWTNRDNKLVPGYREFVNSQKYSVNTVGLPSNPVVGQSAEVDGIFYTFVAELDSNGNLIDSVWKIANLRANLWTINIDANNLVTLTPATFLRTVTVGSGIITQKISSTISTGDTVQVNYGAQRSETLVLYNPILSIGQSVPAYTILPTTLITSDKITRFDGYGTRFINNRIFYEDPEVNDSWLKFPNTGPLL